MTDEEAERMLPVVDEFVDAVLSRDEATVWACMEFTDPRTLAVLCADLLAHERARVGELVRVEAAYLRARRDLVRERGRVAELREIQRDQAALMGELRRAA